MHETSVVHALMEQVGTFLENGRRVISVHIDIGDLEHLDEFVMQTAWTAMADETPMAGSALEIDRIPIRLRCRSCAHEYEPGEDVLFRCPACGAARPEVLQGSGVLLKRIELEDD